jgi:predicted double-glycine peptidase
MKRLLALFIFGGFIIALMGCAGVSEVKKETGIPDSNTTVMIRTGFGGYITKHVVSVRELRYIDIVPQKYDFSCGSASMATILKYLYDVPDVKEDAIVKEMIEKGDQQKIREKGFSLLDMKKYAERHGFQANGYKVKAENLPKLKIPSIVLISTNGYKHFVILKGIKTGRAYLADPAIGNRSVSFSNFRKQWDGVVFVVYKKTDKELALPLNGVLKPPVDNVLNLQNIGIRNYIRLPGEF